MAEIKSQADTAMMVAASGMRAQQARMRIIAENLANAEGYVSLPNVDSLIEALDMKEAQRAYEANLNVIETARSMEMRTLELLKR
jgi:flagellar basal-body rod protein FlgC